MPIVFTYRSFDKNKNNDTPSGRRDNKRDKKVSLFLFLLVALFTLVITISTTTPSIAVHKGAGDLVCGGCHTMHSSQGGASGTNNNMGTPSGAIILLRGAVTSRGNIQKLCLQCHSQTGSQAANVFQPHGYPAPKVLGSNWDQNKSFGEIGAGGDFVKEIDGVTFDPTTDGNNNALGYGHSVGKNGASPPGNPYNPTVNLTCTTCHDPHGTTQNTWDVAAFRGVNVYRNLEITFGRSTGNDGDSCNMQLCHNLIDPNAPGELWQMKSWVGGINAAANFAPSYTTIGNVAIWPVYKGDPAIAANNNVYDGISDTSNDLNGAWGDGGMGEWCARCHPKMHEGTAAGSGNASGQDWKRHPANLRIDQTDVSGAGVNTIDWTHYTGVPCAGTDCYKLPAANTNATLSTEHYYADAEGAVSGDKVFCLSCHFAHAGPYYDALRWDYIAAVDAGSQVGNGVPSNRGCQQCHNR